MARSDKRREPAFDNERRGGLAAEPREPDSRRKRKEARQEAPLALTARLGCSIGA